MGLPPGDHKASKFSLQAGIGGGDKAQGVRPGQDHSGLLRGEQLHGSGVVNLCGARRHHAVLGVQVRKILQASLELLRSDVRGPFSLFFIDLVRAEGLAEQHEPLLAGVVSASHHAEGPFVHLAVAVGVPGQRFAHFQKFVPGLRDLKSQLLEPVRAVDDRVGRGVPGNTHHPSVDLSVLEQVGVVAGQPFFSQQALQVRHNIQIVELRHKIIGHKEHVRQVVPRGHGHDALGNLGGGHGNKLDLHIGVKLHVLVRQLLLQIPLRLLRHHGGGDGQRNLAGLVPGVGLIRGIGLVPGALLGVRLISRALPGVLLALGGAASGGCLTASASSAAASQRCGQRQRRQCPEYFFHK